MYRLRVLIASSVTVFLMALASIPVSGQSQAPVSDERVASERVVVPSLSRPRGTLKPPVLDAAGPDEGVVPGRTVVPRSVLIPAGTDLSARLTERLTSKTSRPGDRFEALLDRDLTAGGEVVVPRGTLLTGVVEESLQGGRVRGRASLTVALREIRLDGSGQGLTTSRVTLEAGSSKKKDATKVAVASGIGAAVGAIFGGKGGAAIGAAVGGGAGGARVLTSRGKPAVIEKEQLLTFRLEEDVTISLPEVRSIDP